MSAIRDRDKYFQLNADGRLGVNMFRRDVLPIKMAFDTVQTNSAYPFTISASGSITPPKIFKQPLNLAQNSRLLDIGNPFIWQHSMFEDSTDGTASADWTIFINNAGQQRAFSNFPIHIQTMFGTAQLPSILREPYYFAPNDQLSVYLNKISGGASTARLFLGGTQYAAWSTQLYGANNPSAQDVFKRIAQWKERKKYVTPYWVSPNFLSTSGAAFVTLTANQTLQFDTNIPEDAHFEAFTMMAKATGNFGLQISEVKTKRTLMNGQVTQTNAIGTPSYPTLFATPYLIPAGYKLRFQLTNLTGSNNTIWLTLGGRKIYAPLADVQAVLKDTAVKDVVRAYADEDSQFSTKSIV